MTIETDVIRAIVGSAISAIGTSLPIKAPRRIFEAPDDGKYFEIVVIQDDNANESWGNEQRFSGQLLVILHWPKSDEGDYPAMEIVTALKPSFSKGMRAGMLLFTAVPRMLDPIDEDAETLYPLRAAYGYYHNPA